MVDLEIVMNFTIYNMLTSNRCVAWSESNQEEDSAGVGAGNATETTPLCEEFIEDESQPKILQFIESDLEY